jgi:hypothetical protein
MNCEQFQDIYQDLARNEWLDPVTLKDALEHADSCGACDDLLQEAESLSASLRSLAAVDSSRQAGPQVEKDVLIAFAAHESAANRRSNLRMATVASLACVAAAALFALLLLHHKPSPGPQGARPSSPAANTSNGRQEASLDEGGAPAIAQGDALSAFEEEDDAAGSFVPLTRTFDRTSLDGDAVVRVVMSPTALQQFGLVAGRSSEKQVLADMVVTSDGTPQAIRLVGK